MWSVILLALMAIPMVQAERVLGAYIFARHGDRTSKVLGSTELTDLGYKEVYLAGSYYHNRYISAGSPLQIAGISEQIVNTQQLTASSPSDAVLQTSAMGFLQGVYPPAGDIANQTLRNDTTVVSPLNGYQLIPVSTVTSGTNSEDSTWLQASSGCQKAKVSSNNFYSSNLYHSLLDSTRGFYQSLSPILDGAFNDSQMTFKKAYALFDYVNVASIHNTTNDLPSSELLTPEAQHQLLTLASVQQYNLAYNESDPIRAIEGSKLAGGVLLGLNQVISSKGQHKLDVQFGSYGTFLSYFGLAQLPSVNVNFTGIPQYASSMAWELITDSTADFPATSEINVRFIFHNGTITGSSAPTEYPLYGQSSATIPYTTFVDQTKKIAVTSQGQFCQVCGNTGGACGASSASSNSGGMSKAVAGVVGAMVTLGAILVLELAVLLLGGFRIAKKGKDEAGSDIGEENVTENKPQSSV